MRDLALRAPPSLAVAENATSPAGQPGAEIWSTTAGKKLTWDGSKWAGGGAGDLVGPASATDTAIARYNGTSGKLVEGSLVTLSDEGVFGVPAVASEPAAPSSGILLYAKEIVPGHTGLKVMRSSGVDSPVQDSLSFNRIVKYQGGPSGIVAIGGGALTASSGGAAIVPAAGTGVQNAVSKTQYSTAATANALTALYANATQLGSHTLRGTIAGEGGFRVVMRFRISATQAGMRFFSGLRDVVTVPTNVDPFTSTTPGGVGLACNLATSANWRLIHTLTGSTPTTIDLGANFPVNTADLIELVLFCRPFNVTAGDIGYRVRRYTTNASAPNQEATGTLSTNLPTGATLLHISQWMVNVAAAVASWQTNMIAVESDW